MKYIKKLGVLLISLLLLPLQSDRTLNATVRVQGQENLQRAAVSLVKWFKVLINEIDELVEMEEKRDLIENLTDLKKDIYNLEQNKRYFIESLKQDQLSNYELKRALEDLEQSLSKARNRVQKTGLILREQHRSGGLEAEQELNRAMGRRKGWIGELKRALEHNEPINKEEMIKKGDEAIKSLRDATLELIKLIANLEKS